MKVTVILPTFNRAAFLKRSIESVLNQTYKNLELIIVDDGSTDETSTLLQEYQKNPHVRIFTQPNKGVSSARNLGIEKSHSDFLAFIDSDDEWLSKKLEVQMERASQYPEFRFFHSNEYWIRNGQRVNIPKKFDKTNENIFERSLHHCLISPSTVLVKRELLHEVGLFDEELTICEDYDLWLRILLKEEVFHEEEFLIKKYGGHADQLSTKYFAMDFWRVKSLIKLLSLESTKGELIQRILLEKVSLLIKGYQKHQNIEDLDKLKRLVLQSTKLDGTAIFSDGHHDK